jgi:hypothetical protein
MREIRSTALIPGLSSQQLDAAIGEDGCHKGQVSAVNEQGTLVESVGRRTL